MPIVATQTVCAIPDGTSPAPFGGWNTVSPFAANSLAGMLLSLATANTSVSPGQNIAFFMPFYLTTRQTARQMFWTNTGTVAGNVDVGIYQENGTRLVSSGSTAMAGANLTQVVDIADTVLNAGGYFMAFVSDSATATFTRWGASQVSWARASGLQQQSAAFPLPDPAVMVNQAGGFMIIRMGISTSTVL